MSVRRLNWGCGQETRPGWINADKGYAPGVDLVCDIRDGIPLDESSLDYIVSIHVLPEIPYPQVEDALWELRRLLKPEGVLRLGLPDLDKAIDAYRRNDRGYFLVPDEDAETTSGKMIVQLLWYGRSCMLLNYEFCEELLRRAGFRRVVRCAYRQTQSPWPEIVELDNRERESVFVEATK
jgi:predicted SAM-dependent methyltransferase